ncbi:MAG: fatty acid desaturase [candidate division Zixibacteria bacterium]|nr:fatty acid desaturase [candidate division Zixibacteria bacterium]
MATSDLPADNPEPIADQDVLTEGPKYNAPPVKTRVRWYRCHVSRENLARLNRRSDFLGFAQTLGHLGVLATSAGAAIYSSLHWPWYVTALLVFVNGHFWPFLINGFHELVHGTVFRTAWLNVFFLRIFSFLGWYNHHHFWASHTEHHKYTLHPPDDLEVVLPQKYDIQGVWKWGIVNWRYPYNQIKGKWRNASGHLPGGQWTQMIFPETDPERRRAFFRWERIVLTGHLCIAATALALGYWIVPLVITYPMMFGAWLQFFCNAAQHVGLQDKVPDFRLCCRTIYLNPVFQFFYWHMNYHTEHHMYAAVPCYRLGRLHRLIQAEMPHCPNGLRETWKVIAEIQRKQAGDSGYQFIPELPTPGVRVDVVASA